MKKQGYKANRPSSRQIAADYERCRLKTIDRIEEERRLKNQKRIEEGLPPIEYEPMPREISPMTPRLMEHILRLAREGNKSD